MDFFVYTFGCQMNYSDTERIESVLDTLGYNKVKSPKQADLIIFNTCSVRQKAEDRVSGQMNNMALLKKKNPNLVIGITGCMIRKSGTNNSQEKDPILRDMKTVDFVFRIEDLPLLPGYLKEFHSNQIIENSFTSGSTLASYFQITPKYSSSAQVCIPIMTGCDNFCTYCIVPYTRGREHSRSIEEIMRESEKLVKNGCIEITLLGQNVNSYGKSPLDKNSGKFDKKDKNPFVSLLKQLNNLESLKRLRFSSPHPKDMDDETIEAIAGLPKMCPYVHLPVQAGDDEILQRMNRGYTISHYKKIVEKLRKLMPQMTLSTDLIIGFPGETDDQFENTYDFFKDIGFDMSYTSQYSPRLGTASAKLYKDDVPKMEKHRRWHKVNNLLKEICLQKNKKYIGETVEVLAENCNSKGECLGKTDTFKTVQFKGLKEAVGKIVPVKITEAKEWILTGNIV